MAIFLFVFPSYPDCVERLVVSSPYVRQTQTKNGLAMLPDPATTWAQIRQLPYPWPQNLAPQPFLLTAATSAKQQQQPPDILCIQIAQPEVSRQMVNSGMPVGAPVGNQGHAITPPPMVGTRPPAGVQVVHSGLYDQIPDSGLPSSVDAMLGDSDPSGGTYTDIGRDGIEEKRVLQRPYGAPPTAQQGGGA